ncbi:MAG: outer membrane protein assembly factor BamC [Hahellaceae bacterium]|nr:outer membrane protein assembly factor BamC [Hahellaceae bacterium]
MDNVQKMLKVFNGNSLKRGAITAILLSVGGCGNLVRDRSTDYIDAPRGEPLTIPEWYENDKIQSRYPIPEATNKVALSRDYHLPEPPDTAINVQEQFYELEKIDDQVWLLVSELPGRVWPAMDQYFESNGLRLAHQNPRIGLMQTEPLTQSVKARALLTRFGVDVDAPELKNLVIQARLTQGVKRTSAELQVRLITPNDPAAFQSWKAQTERAGAEELMLAEIGDWLESKRGSKTYSLLAQDIGGSSRVSLISEENSEAWLRIDLAFERAWHATARALKKSNVRVVDIDRSQGAYFVNYKDPNDKPGWFMSLFTSTDDQDQILGNNYNLLVKLSHEQDFVRLFVENAKESELTVEQRRTVLNALLENIN